MYQITLSIDGMACSMCESHVCDTIRSKFSVKKVTASHSKGEAVILTMSYVLNSLNREETIAMENEEEGPGLDEEDDVDRSIGERKREFWTLSCVFGDDPCTSLWYFKEAA